MAYTADKKPSALSDASTPLGEGDEIVLSQSGDVRKASLADVEAKIFSTKTGKSWSQVTGTEIVVVRETDNSLKQVALDAIVKQKLIVNDHVSDGAAIADTKLATISTAGKVLNSATTATSASTANAIVARDSSKNFSAGTITATLSGNATTATTLATGRTISLTGDVTATTASFDGSGNVSGTATIAANAVTTAKILDANVTTAKIADKNVTDAKLRDSAALSIIGRSANSTGVPADIAAASDGQVLRRSGTVLGFGTVATAGITDAAVTAAKLATDSVETAKIKDANVTTLKIADANVTAAKLATDSVETAKIKDANVTAAKLASDSVETAKIKDANVTASKLSGAQSGNAPIYGCRAWVNFDGVNGSTIDGEFRCTIRAGGNVSKVVRITTGSFEIYFTTPMLDADYSFAGCVTTGNGYIFGNPWFAQTANKLPFYVGNNSQYLNPSVGCLQIFR